MKKILLLGVTHLLAVVVGFALGVYLLPILTAPPAPTTEEVERQRGEAVYTAQFRRDLEGSDALHWGEGTVSIGSRSISLMGRLAPGPDYKLYLSPEFVETETDFERHRERMVRVGDVDTFENFLVPLPATVDPEAYTTVIVWCEAFSQFITAAKYR